MLPLTTLEKNIRENLKYNITVNLCDGSLFGAALGFASFSTILPLFVASMTDSALLIGLVPAIHSVGWQLPQLFTASHVSRLRQYKRTVIMTTIHERVPFLGFAIVALLLPFIGLQAGLVITFLLLTWQGLGGGFTANSWTSMISTGAPPPPAPVGSSSPEAINSTTATTAAATRTAPMIQPHSRPVWHAGAVRVPVWCCAWSPRGAAYYMT